MTGPVRLELSVDTLAGALAADRIGADRIELCAASGEGGLTPSHGMIAEAVRRCQAAEVHVLVRPRSGDFVYPESVIAAMASDVADAVRLGARGVVTGVLDGGGKPDVPAMRELLAAAAGAEVTFHRAVDACADPRAACARLAELGVTRVLTSGQAASAVAGAPLIAELAAAGPPAIMACGGIRPHNVAEVLAATGVRDIHAAPRTAVPATVAAPAFVARAVPSGFDHEELDEQAAAELRAQLSTPPPSRP